MNCPACEVQVEAGAEKCGQCGFPVREAQLATFRLYVMQAGLGISVLCYAAIALLLPAPATPLPPEILTPLGYGMLGLGATLVGVVYFWPEAPQALAPAAAMQRTVLPSALAEVPGVLALVHHFLGGSREETLVLIAVSLAGMAINVVRLPRLAQAVRRHLVEQGRDSPS